MIGAVVMVHPDAADIEFFLTHHAVPHAEMMFEPRTHDHHIDPGMLSLRQILH